MIWVEQGRSKIRLRPKLLTEGEPHQIYKLRQILTAQEEQLLFLLYDEAILSLKKAISSKKEKKKTAQQGIRRTQEILEELKLSLDLRADELALNLYILYDYLQRQLEKGGLEQIKEVLEVFTSLRKAWTKVLKSKPR
ncbi:MAG: hypothetical protein COS84_08645 [Armatimonadetes bacterium CG07_land_8_20_14_0_80_40_9]|nr:MAG: hypothetical protein COS84_08645 [Armatimonadetes bacterium CG07_land_8_20_14_0_80_40_9]